MAKGNMLLGYARGSVGDVTFSRVKGNQVAKARNRNPSNPNTIPQAMQRALFTDAVKFYTRGVQNLFRFAFEDKKAEESDFNAFMRTNINRGVRIAKANEPAYPAVGDWIVANGSITPPECVDAVVGSQIPGTPSAAGSYIALDESLVYEEGDDTNIPAALSLSFELQSSAPTTIGQLSTLFLSQFPQLRSGDIITMLLISQGGSNPIGDLVPNVNGNAEGLFGDPRWDFAQFIIDETSTAAVSTIYNSPGSNLTFNNPGGGPSFLNLVRFHEIPASSLEVGNTYYTIAAGAVIFSRETSSGLLVSYAPLSRGFNYSEFVRISRSDAHVQGVMAEWGAVDPAILQGGFVQI